MAGKKNGRDAFIFMKYDPRIPPAYFAQCIGCRRFVPSKFTEGDIDLCIDHGSKVKVGPYYSCGVYAKWPRGKPEEKVIKNHAAELAGDLPGAMTPAESGLVERDVRCINCIFFMAGARKCGLYIALNKEQPEKWDLDPNVEKYDCCNANLEREGPQEDDDTTLKKAFLFVKTVHVEG